MEIKTSIPLKDYTTFKIGGSAAFFVSAHTVPELQEALAFAKAKGLPVFVLGGGSNVLVSDKGFNGLVVQIKTKGITFAEDGGGMVATVSAGENWDEFVAASVVRNVYGIENLSAIPGLVGAAPIQNIGAYGVDASQTIRWVEALDMHTLEVKRFSNAACAFSYRDSFFKTDEGKRYIVTQACFRLAKDGELNTSYKDVVAYFEQQAAVPTLAGMREAIIAIRSRKFPDMATLGTAGSYFKNPIVQKEQADALQKRYPRMPVYDVDETKKKIPIAWVLDHVLNLKGVRHGAVGTAENNALAFVNYGSGTAEEMTAFAEYVTKKVREAIGVEVIPEVTYIESQIVKSKKQSAR